MASMVIRRKAGMLEFTDEFVQSPAVQDMMDRVEAVIDPEIDALGRHKIVSLIEVRMKDGRVLKGRSPEHYRGGPRNPLSRESLAEKFNDCVQNVLNRDQAKTLLKTIESLERVGNIRTLTKRAVAP
jgi:2-methylcitrate dehydratase PrpD